MPWGIPSPPVCWDYRLAVTPSQHVCGCWDPTPILTHTASTLPSPAPSHRSAPFRTLLWAAEEPWGHIAQTWLHGSIASHPCVQADLADQLLWATLTHRVIRVLLRVVCGSWHTAPSLIPTESLNRQSRLAIRWYPSKIQGSARVEKPLTQEVENELGSGGTHL